MPHDLHPAGKGFLGTITDHGFSESKDGASQVFLTIQNDDNPQHIITKFLSMSEKAIEWTVKQLRRAGFTGYDFTDLADGQLLVGNQVRYEVEHEEWDGEIRAKVGWINDPDRVGIQRSDSAASNAKRFNAVLKQHPPEKKATTVQTPQPGNEPF